MVFSMGSLNTLKYSAKHSKAQLSISFISDDSNVFAMNCVAKVDSACYEFESHIVKNVCFSFGWQISFLLLRFICLAGVNETNDGDCLYELPFKYANIFGNNLFMRHHFIRTLGSLPEKEPKTTRHRLLSIEN